LKLHWYINVEIQFHTDYRGSVEFNKRLSQARSDAYREYLINNGIKGSRLSSIGYGENKPLVVPEKGTATSEISEWNRGWGRKYEPGDVLTQEFIDGNFKRGSEYWEHAMQKNFSCDVYITSTLYPVIPE